MRTVAYETKTAFIRFILPRQLQVAALVIIVTTLIVIIRAGIITDCYNVYIYNNCYAGGI